MAAPVFESALATPDTGHLGAAEYADVYEPAEDTFLLLDALQQDWAAITAAQPAVCVEVGSGSGTVVSFFGMHCGPSCRFLATDVNAKACAATQQTAERNGVAVETVHTNLTDGLPEGVEGSVDVLLFNPPYVVTEPSEVGGDQISAAWAGGKHGREVIDAFLPRVPALLSPTGRFYLLVLAANKREGTPDDITEAIPGLRGECIISRKAGIEHLSVIRFTRC